MINKHNFLRYLLPCMLWLFDALQAIQFPCLPNLLFGALAPSSTLSTLMFVLHTLRLSDLSSLAPISEALLEWLYISSACLSAILESIVSEQAATISNMFALIFSIFPWVIPSTASLSSRSSCIASIWITHISIELLMLFLSVFIVDSLSLCSLRCWRYSSSVRTNVAKIWMISWFG